MDATSLVTSIGDAVACASDDHARSGYRKQPP